MLVTPPARSQRSVIRPAWGKGLPAQSSEASASRIAGTNWWNYMDANRGVSAIG